MTPWEIAQQHEKNWWGACRNTFGEEAKQLFYGEKMGLQIYDDGNSPFNIKSPANRIIDIGSGPVSMLLKVDQMGPGFVRVAADPCDYPEWIKGRYTAAGILYEKVKGEDLIDGWEKTFDEAWVYNVLQHTEDPEKVISRAKKLANKIRLFEWIDHPTNAMHPHMLTEDKLNEWLGGKGTVETLNTQDLQGKCYYGEFNI